MEADRILARLQPSRILQLDAVKLDAFVVETALQTVESGLTFVPVCLPTRQRPADSHNVTYAAGLG